MPRHEANFRPTRKAILTYIIKLHMVTDPARPLAHVSLRGGNSTQSDVMDRKNTWPSPFQIPLHPLLQA